MLLEKLRICNCEAVEGVYIWRATRRRCRWWGDLELRAEMTEHFPPVLLSDYLAPSLPWSLVLTVMTSCGEDSF